MLNRRLLRIKAMQMLYAFQVSKQADQNIALETIETILQPNLLLEEPEDPQVMKSYRAKAKEIFLSNYEQEAISFPSDTVARIKDAVLSGIKEYKAKLKKDQFHFSERLVIETQRLYGTYLKALDLLIQFADASEEELKRRIKIYPNELIVGSAYNFTRNPFVAMMRQDERFNSEKLRFHVDWGQDNELIWSWYKEFLKKNESYREYMSIDSPSQEQHKDIMWVIAREIIFKHEGINAYFEGEDLSWVEDHAIIKSMVKKTLKDMQPDGWELLELSVNWEEDKEFIEVLYEASVSNEKRFEGYLQPQLQNWDMERITPLDRIILTMALAEMVEFPNIPVKVTINEYIEISKLYSTPKSKQFINGVLDAVSTKMVEEGQIRKSGRGLIDNK